jgi:carotenoid 1,2-hydratase
VSISLDASGKHYWRPIAPRARVEVTFRKPEFSWVGTGYFDHNIGVEPLEDGFSSWTWARGALPEGAAVVYDVVRRDGTPDGMALRFRADGTMERVDPPPRSKLATTSWKMTREIHSDAGSTPRLLVTYEDTPFYARSLVEATLFGHEVPCFHESLSLDRFRRPEVRFLLPFRMPRVVDGVKTSRLAPWRAARSAR